MATFDTIISGGRIIDGKGSQRSTRIVVVEGRIAAIGRFARSKAKHAIDAKDKIVAPRHVTQHTRMILRLSWENTSFAVARTPRSHCRCGRPLPRTREPLAGRAPGNKAGEASHTMRIEAKPGSEAQQIVDNKLTKVNRLIKYLTMNS